MYKVKNKLAPTITANIFGKITENHYNLRSYNDYHGTDSISYLGTKIWDILFL